MTFDSSVFPVALGMLLMFSIAWATTTMPSSTDTLPTISILTTTAATDASITTPATDASITTAATDASITTAATDASITTAATGASITTAATDASITTEATDASITTAATDASITTTATDASITTTATGASITTAATGASITTAETTTAETTTAASTTVGTQVTTTGLTTVSSSYATVVVTTGSGPETTTTMKSYDCYNGTCHGNLTCIHGTSTCTITDSTGGCYVSRYNATSFEFGCRPCTISQNTEADWCCQANKDCVFGVMPTIGPTTVAYNNNGVVAMVSSYVTNLVTVIIISVLLI